MQEKQEKYGGWEVHGGEGGEEGRLLACQGNLGRMFSDDWCGRIQAAGHSCMNRGGRKNRMNFPRQIGVYRHNTKKKKRQAPIIQKLRDNMLLRESTLAHGDLLSSTRVTC